MTLARPTQDRRTQYDRLVHLCRSRLLLLLCCSTLSITLGCSENPYEPMESSQDFYFAGPSKDQEEQATSPAQPSIREVATISGERFWEFEDPYGPELRLLPPVQQDPYLTEQPLPIEPALSRTPWSSQPKSQHTIKSIKAPKHTAKATENEDAEFVKSDAYQGKQTPPLEVTENAVKETFDSTIAVMLLPPMPVEVVGREDDLPEPTLDTAESDSDAWGDFAETDSDIDDDDEATDWSFATESHEEAGEELSTIQQEPRLALLPTPTEEERSIDEPSVEEPRLRENLAETMTQEQKARPHSSFGQTPPAITTGVLTGAKVNEQAIAKIRRGYKLASRGAYYAARAEFVAVLRMISQAKDSKHGKPRRTVALAAGLRALEEAADFAPQGAELDAEVPVAVIASSHRTPIRVDLENKVLLPQQMMDRYFRYAQFKLGGAVAGEPAGSMALHALGKLHSQLGKLEPEQHPQAQRQAYAFQQAALMAHSNNHLAAHELGVLMAEAGHYQEANDLLNQVVRRQPHPTVLRNLARVQKELGQRQVAVAMRQRAREMERHSGVVNGVAWMTPDAFSALGRRPTNMPVQQRPAQQLARRPHAVQQPTTAPPRQRIY